MCLGQNTTICPRCVPWVLVGLLILTTNPLPHTPHPHSHHRAHTQPTRPHRPQLHIPCTSGEAVASLHYNMTNTHAPEGGLKTPEVTRAPFRPRETLNGVTGLVQELEATRAQKQNLKPRHSAASPSKVGRPHRVSNPHRERTRSGLSSATTG